MTTDREQFDAFDDDADVVSLLRSPAPSPREEFLLGLAERLDAGFAARQAARGQQASLPDKPGHSSANGAAKGRNGVAYKPGLNGQTRQSPVVAAPPPAPAARRRWRRWTAVVVTAASLFVALIVWGPAYGWTAAIRAWVVGLVNSPRVEGATGAAAPLANPEPGNPGQQGLAARDIAVAALPSAAAPVTPPAGDRSDDIAPVLARELPLAPAVAGSNRISAETIVTVEPLSNNSTPAENETASPDPAPAESKTESPAWAPFERPLPIEELRERVDGQLSALWRSRGITPAGPATDAEFMRRAYLDLTGRIPSVNEVHEFLNDSSPDKRGRLVDRLLNHRDHATHLAAVWRGILLPEAIDLARLGGSLKFEEWLAERFGENKPYDQIVRDLLLVEGRVAESGPLLFYSAARLLPEELAGKTSRAFLGVRMECAQCHDHPFDDVSQQDFWRFAAFFARISRPKGKMELTSPVLQVRDSMQGDVTIPDSDVVVPPRLPMMASDIADQAEGPPLRQHLADWLTSPNNGQFARATVNRIWAHLFGRGLVDPVDDMRPANPPLAPDVLDTLARDFAASKFDLRRLLRALVLTDVYQLSSRSEDSDPARTLHFAQMNIKSFTAEQLYDCITIATRRNAPSAPVNLPAAGVERFGDTNRQAFIQQFQAPSGNLTDYQAGIPQALTLMHGGLVHSSTELATSGLLKSLSAPLFDDGYRVNALFLATLSRYPAEAERDVIFAQLSAAETREQKQQVLGDVLWALLNSGEFTFNH